MLPAMGMMYQPQELPVTLHSSERSLKTSFELGTLTTRQLNESQIETIKST